MRPSRWFSSSVAGLALLLVACCTVTPGTKRVDRGFGKTGSFADRGLGGTGGTSLADRGIEGTDGTAIIGAITAFGSVVVNGFEIASDRIRTVQMDGVIAPYTTLRVGQIVRVVATSSINGLRADTVAVEHEVIGQVERVGDDGSFIIAGQRVHLHAEARGERPMVGQSVAVSGFRRGDDEIVASRVDEAPSGETMVAGPLVYADGAPRVGGLSIDARHLSGFVGTRVRARGVLVEGRLRATSIVAAPLVTLRSGLDRAVVQTIATLQGDEVRLGGGLDVRRGLTLGPLPSDRPVIILLLSSSDGSLTAVGTLDGGLAGESAGRDAGPTAAQPSGPSAGPGSAPGSPAHGMGGGSGPGGNAGPGHGSDNGPETGGTAGGGGGGPGGGGIGGAGGGGGGGSSGGDGPGGGGSGGPTR